MLYQIELRPPSTEQVYGGFSAPVKQTGLDYSVPVPARISFDHDLERLESKNKHNCEGKHRKEEYNKKLILQEGMYGVSI